MGYHHAALQKLVAAADRGTESVKLTGTELYTLKRTDEEEQLSLETNLENAIKQLMKKPGEDGVMYAQQRLHKEIEGMYTFNNDHKTILDALAMQATRSRRGDQNVR